MGLHPNSKVMQPDTVFSEEYAAIDTYDTGKGRGKLRWDPLAFVARQVVGGGRGTGQLVQSISTGTA